MRAMATRGGAVLMLVTVCGCGGGAAATADGSSAAGGAMSADGGGGGAGGSGTEGGADRAGAMDALTRPDSLSVDGMVMEQTQCHTLANTAPVIAANVLGMDAVPPDLHGGTITDGRYELVAVDQYPGGSAGPQQPVFQRTVEFQSSATRWLVVNLNYLNPGWIDFRPSFTLAVDTTGAIVATYDACSGQSSAMNQYRYEATADEVAMWNQPTAEVLHYLRAP
jgi:hypothetical protein